MIIYSKEKRYNSDLSYVSGLKIIKNEFKNGRIIIDDRFDKIFNENLFLISKRPGSPRDVYRNALRGGESCIYENGRPVQVDDKYFLETLEMLVWSMTNFNEKLQRDNLPVVFIDSERFLTQFHGLGNNKDKTNDEALTFIVAARTAVERNTEKAKEDGISFQPFVSKLSKNK